MSLVPIKIKMMPNFKDLQLPKYETSGSVGMDVRACIGKNNLLCISPGERVKIPTGLAVQIPNDYEIQVRPRSGLSLRSSLVMVNSPGTIDTDFTGETHIIMANFGNEPYEIHHGDRIAQWVVSPVVKAIFEVVDNLEETERGDCGFGSTGIQ